MRALTCHELISAIHKCIFRVNIHKHPTLDAGGVHIMTVENIAVSFGMAMVMSWHHEFMLLTGRV